MSGAGRHGFDYDLVILGSGPAGQRAAIEASRHGLRVAVVEKQQLVGGVCLHTGTMPSKALREAVVNLTGWRLRTLYPERERSGDSAIGMADLKQHIDRVIARELGVIERTMARFKVDLHYGCAEFTGPYAVRISGPGGEKDLTAESFLIATGTMALRPSDIPFNGQTVIDSDQLYTIPRLPRSILIIGGGVIALEYASVLALLGIRVCLVARGREILPYMDRDIVAAFGQHLGRLGVDMRLGAAIRVIEAEGRPGPRVELDSGDLLECDMVMAAVGRVGTAASLGLAAAGLEPDSRGLLTVDGRYRTAVPHILAAGDVTGRPGTASAARDQGRLAVRHLLDLAPGPGEPGLIPYGLYTVPEMAFVGRTEQELEAEGTPFFRGVASFREVAKGEIIGDETGMLKLLFHADTRRLMGVHLIGTAATEIVHVGHVVMSFGGKLDYFTSVVFNYPTLSECYKIAAFNAEMSTAGAGLR
jgi:NAD(P) transhydrogenase